MADEPKPTVTPTPDNSAAAIQAANELAKTLKSQIAAAEAKPAAGGGVNVDALRSALSEIEALKTQASTIAEKSREKDSALAEAAAALKVANTSLANMRLASQLGVDEMQAEMIHKALGDKVADADALKALKDSKPFLFTPAGPTPGDQKPAGNQPFPGGRGAGEDEMSPAARALHSEINDTKTRAPRRSMLTDWLTLNTPAKPQ